ncbi:hypothetical protein [Planktothrix serta]|uniref:hypothetical protein n=1 Tax=Planktothrix serta TaxID=1678310 RepID=UPI001E47FCFC|nr:hypothetical protein [Planktothrix serta]
MAPDNYSGCRREMVRAALPYAPYAPTLLILNSPFILQLKLAGSKAVNFYHYLGFMTDPNGIKGMF